MAKKKLSKTVSITIRSCANIRSRKHPDVQCPCAATHGDFCTRHYKNPIRYQQTPPLETTLSYSQILLVQKIQRWWKFRIGFLRFARQGPAANKTDVAENQTDIFSLEPTSTIPLLYRWSYADTSKHIWLFDVRSLSMIRAQDARGILLNPYTRDPFLPAAESKYQTRCTWLRSKKYCLMHSQDTELTVDQLWHQRILDVTMKYDMLGYHTCLNWFEELSVRQLASFYLELWELWFYRLQLNTNIKKQVVPNWNTPESLLFKWKPTEILNRNDLKWWQRSVLELLDRLVSSAELKEHRILGALYGMTAFALISPNVRNHYPWLVEVPDDY
jgi:hypothetical protein